MSPGDRAWTIIPDFNSHIEMKASDVPCQPREVTISDVAENGNVMINGIEHCGWQLPHKVFESEREAWIEFAEFHKARRSNADTMISWAESHIS